MEQNECSRCVRISVHDGPEYATEMQTLLSYASYQGMQFLKRLLLETAQNMNQIYTHSVSEPYLSQAIKPHALIIDNTAEIYEFRQKVFHQLANQRLKQRPEIEKNLAEFLVDSGKNWLVNGQDKKLSETEQENFYLLLLDQRSQITLETNLQIHLLTYLVLLYQKQGYFYKTTDYLELLSILLAENKSFHFSLIGFWDQIELLDLFIETNYLMQAESLGKALIKQAQLILNQNPPSEQRLRDVSVSQEKVADVLLKTDQLNDARDLFQQSLSTCETILQDFGISEQRLRDLMVSNFNLFLVYEAENSHRWPYLFTALTICQQRYFQYPQYAELIMPEFEQLLTMAKEYIEKTDDQEARKAYQQFIEKLKT